MRAFRAGFRQARTRGDPWQQGGVLVLDRLGRIAWRHVSETLGEHAEPADVIAALRKVSTSP